MDDPTNKGEGELGILARRRIEAAIVAPIYDEMRQAIGEEKARDILRRAIRRAAIDAGAEMATRAEGGADLESFKAILPLWTKDDALTIEVIDEAPGVLDFNVKRCRYAETYRAMGLSEIGDILSCNRDGAFCEGYDPRIKLTRTQTIMGGASHCDFRYRSSLRRHDVATVASVDLNHFGRDSPWAAPNPDNCIVPAADGGTHP
jgi:hypothetical protein